MYVERRDAIGRGAALDTAGKRAAFALFYGPLHYLLARHVVEGLGADRAAADLVVDLGCGTGAVGAAWGVALAHGRPRVADGASGEPGVRVLGIDRHPWAVEEARWTYRLMGLAGAARREDVVRTRVDGRRRAVVLGYTVNEISEDDRDHLLERLTRAAARGVPTLVIEPVARSIGRWWEHWAAAFRRAGGREDAWRFEPQLPGRVRMLDRAAGLDHRVLTARSLYLAGAASAEERPEP